MTFSFVVRGNPRTWTLGRSSSGWKKKSKGGKVKRKGGANNWSSSIWTLSFFFAWPSCLFHHSILFVEKSADVGWSQCLLVVLFRDRSILSSRLLTRVDSLVRLGMRAMLIEGPEPSLFFSYLFELRILGSWVCSFARIYSESHLEEENTITKRNGDWFWSARLDPSSPRVSDKSDRRSIERSRFTTRLRTPFLWINLDGDASRVRGWRQGAQYYPTLGKLPTWVWDIYWFVSAKCIPYSVGVRVSSIYIITRTRQLSYSQVRSHPSWKSWYNIHPAGWNHSFSLFPPVPLQLYPTISQDVKVDIPRPLLEV